MKRAPFICLFLFACGPAAVLDTSERFTVANVENPLQPMRDGTTTIRVRYPNADLALRGSVAPLSWQTDFAGVREGADIVFHVDFPEGVNAEIKPVRAGAWAKGGNSHVASGETVTVTPYFNSDAGNVTLQYDSFYSHILDNTRDVYVYLPPSYSENTSITYPVLIMHDGQNLFDSSLAFGGNEWKVDEALDKGIREGWLPEIVVLGVANTGARFNEYTPTRDLAQGFGGDGDKYLAFLTDELLPEARKQLRIRTDRESTGIMGSSLGGLISAYAGVKRGDVFGLVGALSPSTWWDDEFIIGAVKTASGQRPQRVYIDSGNAGPSNDDVVNTTALFEQYNALGYTVEHVVQPQAAHSEVYWSQRLPHALWYLYNRGIDSTLTSR